MVFPGHCGILWYEKADARKSNRTKFIGPGPVMSIDAGNMICKIEKETKNKHQNLETCRQAEELFGGYNAQSTKYLLSLIKGNLRQLVVILTGHNSLRYYQLIMGLSHTSACMGCHLKELNISGDYYLPLEEFQEISIPYILSSFEVANR